MQIRSVGRATQEIASNWLPAVQQVAEISQLRLRYRVRSLEAMLATTDEERAKIESSLGNLDSSLEAALRKFEPLIVSNEQKMVFQEAIKAVAAYRSTVQEALRLVKSGKLDAAQNLRRTTWVKAADQVRDQVDALVKISRAGSESAASEAERDVSMAINAGLLALLAGLAVAMVSTFLIARSISRRLSSSVDSAQQIAAGDLTGMMPARSNDEVGKLIAALAEMQQSLRDTMQETSGSAESILDCSKHLNLSVHQMEQSTGIQRSVASSIAAALDEMTVSIKHVSDNASDAARYAQESDRQASDGCSEIEKLIVRIGEVASVVRSAAGQISRLEGESAKISNIVGVIKEIADQTNLLALNAAIDATRAGEQGCGFAVVADEVRKLSERTALSTGEIEKMVGGIQVSTRNVVTEVGRGVTLVDEGVSNARTVGESIATLRAMAQEVSRLVASAADALHQQSAASSDVARKVGDVATQAEEATAIAHQTSPAADLMAQTANRMRQLVARFRVSQPVGLDGRACRHPAPYARVPGKIADQSILRFLSFCQSRSMI